MVHIWATEPKMTIAQLQSIKCPTLVIAGDDDVIKINHTNEIYEAIENSRLAIIPGSSHLIDKDQPELLNKIIRDFLLKSDYPITLMPVRRKSREVQ
jgi:pimeloyl-ACP methyl ester carboxylesterase